MAASDAAALRVLVAKLASIGQKAMHASANGKKTSAGSAKMQQANLAGLAGVIADLGKKDVLIGIPREKAPREDDSQMNNAARAYILENGSAAAHIPARPFLVPGVEAALPRAKSYLMQGVKKAIKGDQGAIDKALTAAGITAEREVVKKINSNIPPPLSPFTVMWRHRDRGGRPRKSELAYEALINIGYTAAQAQAATGIKSLVNTGEMRNSVTHIVRTQ